MQRYLNNAGMRQRTKAILGFRFAEVIVDEVQDCSESDIAILDLILDAGIRLVCVGDKDQAIYGFRSTDVQPDLDSVRQRTSQTPRLDDNFRSSPAICGLVDSLRSTPDQDNPVGEHALEEEPVHIVTFQQPSEVHTKVAAILDESDTQSSDAIVLAHALATCRRATGGQGSAKWSGNRLVRFASAVDDIQNDSSTAVRRQNALRSFQRNLYEIAGAGLSEADYLEQVEATERTLRETCLRIATSFNPPFESKPSKFKTELVDKLANLQYLGCDLSKLRKPPGDKWPTTPPRPESDALSYSTIHGFKGLQKEAVILVIPKAADQNVEDGTQYWLSNTSGEARRVLYVGVSRAKRLLILAIHKDRCDPITQRLASDRVPHTIHQ
jgi:superfamily I DNA/RNA helicase